MILGLIGDVHAEDALLERALHNLRDVDRVLCTGDVADGPGDLSRCIALLRERNATVVRGNHDRWIVQNTMRSLDHAQDPETLTRSERAWLESLPGTVELESPRGQILLCHGVGHDDMRVVSEDTNGYDLQNNEVLQHFMAEAAAGERYAVVGGHKHRYFTRAFGALLWVNPGTLKRNKEPCCARWDLGSGVLTRFLL